MTVFIVCLILSFFVFFTGYFDLPRFLPSLTIIENIPTTNDDLTMMKRKEPGGCGKLSVMGTQQTRNICITFVQCNNLSNKVTKNKYHDIDLSQACHPPVLTLIQIGSHYAIRCGPQ